MFSMYRKINNSNFLFLLQLKQPNNPKRSNLNHLENNWTEGNLIKETLPKQTVS